MDSTIRSPTIAYQLAILDICVFLLSYLYPYMNLDMPLLPQGILFLGSSEGIQIEYIAVFLAVLFPGALVAFNHELLEMIPRVATLRIYCAGIWHNAAFCVVCALTLFLLPLIFYPLYSHGENLMALDVSAESPLYNYLSPGDLITKLDGKHIRTSKEWMETTYFLNKQLFQTKDNYISNKGYCVPNLVIAESKNVEIVDNEFKCPDELTLFTTVSCVDLNIIHDGSSNGTDHQLTRENVYCFPAKGVLGEKKCGDGWDNIVRNNSNCLCAEDESCVTPVHPPGVAWVEITYSRPCSRYNSSDLEENKCGGTFVFIGDMMLMARSVWLTEYQPRWLYGVAYIPVVVEKLLVNSFHVSLMLALLNSLPVYYLDGESILEVALCCFGSLTPRIREVVLRSSLVAGTVVCCLLLLRILLVITY